MSSLLPTRRLPVAFDVVLDELLEGLQLVEELVGGALAFGRGLPGEPGSGLDRAAPGDLVGLVSVNAVNVPKEV